LRIAAFILCGLLNLGCNVVIAPLARDEVEPIGEGKFVITELSPAGESLSPPAEYAVSTAVYAETGRARGSEVLRIALYSDEVDFDRLKNSTLHYLVLEVTLKRGTDIIEHINVHDLSMLARPNRDVTYLYRYARAAGDAQIKVVRDGPVRGRFVFDMVYVFGLPAREPNPVRVEVEFTAHPHVEFIRRLRNSLGETVRGMEAKHLSRTSRADPEGLDTTPLPRER